MKVRAYYKEENGNSKMITAFGVLNKEKAEPGCWRRRAYLSTHPPDKRLPMHHRRKSNGICCFVYNPKDKKQAERLGGGESLAHYLFKTAISELTSSELKIGYHHPSVKIRFKNLRTEKEIVHNGKKFYIDVFGEFESSSQLQLKWGGLIGIEVCHSNPVEKGNEKMAAFRSLELPVVQIKINDKLLYRTPEHLSTPDKEKKYMKDIVFSLGQEQMENTLIVQKLGSCIEKGVAFHNAGLSSIQKRAVEQGFKDRMIKFIIL